MDLVCLSLYDSSLELLLLPRASSICRERLLLLVCLLHLSGASSVLSCDGTRRRLPSVKNFCRLSRASPALVGLSAVCDRHLGRCRSTCDLGLPKWAATRRASHGDVVWEPFLSFGPSVWASVWPVSVLVDGPLTALSQMEAGAREKDVLSSESLGR